MLQWWELIDETFSRHSHPSLIYGMPIHVSISLAQISVPMRMYERIVEEKVEIYAATYSFFLYFLQASEYRAHAG